MDRMGAAADRPLPDTETGRLLKKKRKEIVTAADRRGASNVRVFGSVARGDDKSSSDIDLLVDVGDGVGLVSLISLERELSEILGRPVDVVPARNLKERVSESVLKDAVYL